MRYAHDPRGDEKGVAQVFCDRLFQAFVHEGYKEAGATLEFRVRAKGKRTRFADLLWRLCGNGVPVVEWSFGRLLRNRRLSNDYERKAQSSETFVEVAMIRLMLKRLARGA